MSKTQDALKLALEALEEISSQYMSLTKKGCMALDAICEVLAQPEGCQCPACKIAPHESDCPVHNEPALPNGPCDCGAQTYPDNFIDALKFDVAKRDSEAQQEPVAMRYDFDGYGWKYIDSGSGSDWKTRIKGAEPIYTSPPASKPWVGLTDEEIERCMKQAYATVQGRNLERAFALAIEAKLKEKNNG